MKKTLAGILFWLALIANALLSIWCVGAIWYQHGVETAGGKWSLIGLFVLAETMLMATGVRRRWPLFVAAALSLGVTAAWLGLQSPTGQHDWDPPFARMPTATFSPNGKTVTIENVRDFHYRSEDDYDIRYRSETYNLDELETLDYSITHWNGNGLFGHIMYSFGFRDGRHLVYSPEARMECGRKYELLPGFFRQYELIFIFATEEDAYQLRTHHRRYEQSEVLLYPTRSSKMMMRLLLTDLLRRANNLSSQPEYYNGIVYNCFSTILPTSEKLPMDVCRTWHGIFNGITDRIAWDLGWLKRTIPGESFEDYKKRHTINQYVEHLNNPTNYSQLIRPDELHLQTFPSQRRQSYFMTPTSRIERARVPGR